MAKSLHPYDQLLVEEEYIDMDIINSSILCYTISSPQHSREFEFPMSVQQTNQRETTTSPADELFYKGKLLPLHLPPRLRMVQMLFEQSTMNTTSLNTPLGFSGELNPDKYFTVQRQANKFWSKRLKLGGKLKASRAYIKSLFNPTATLGTSIHEGKQTDEDCGYRRSFSGAISTVKSSFCAPNVSSTEDRVLKRSGSVNSEVEKSIQGAIAYCKRSQQQILSGRKNVGDLGYCSFTSSRIAAACENQETSGLCRG